jgi:HEAT repeat protein
MQSRGDVEGLIETLSHPEPAARKGAAAALRVLGAWQAVPALEAALMLERDWQSHAAIAAAIKYLDRDVHIEAMVKNRDVRGIIKMLNSPKLEDLLIACQALAAIGDRQAAEPLVMVFRNPMLPNKARLAAAEALLKLESAPAVVTLLGALRRDDWQVRRNAAAVLGQLQATWASEPLIKALDDPNPVVRRTAAAALRRIGTPEATKAAQAFETVQARLAAQEAAHQRSMVQEPDIEITPRKTSQIPIPPSVRKTGGHPAVQSAPAQAAPAMPESEKPDLYIGPDKPYEKPHEKPMEQPQPRIEAIPIPERRIDPIVSPASALAAPNNNATGAAVGGNASPVTTTAQAAPPVSPNASAPQDENRPDNSNSG